MIEPWDDSTLRSLAMTLRDDAQTVEAHETCKRIQREDQQRQKQEEREAKMTGDQLVNLVF